MRGSSTEGSSRPDLTMGLDPALTFIRPPGVATAEQAVRHLGRAAVQQGFARASYPDALWEREQRYPTGLPTPLPIAIPHADSGHVSKMALGALVPEYPLVFQEMGGSGRSLQAELVLLLCVDDPSQQVPLLGRLLAIMQRTDLRQRLLAGLSTPAELVERFDRLARPNEDRIGHGSAT